jgi:pimeloyl-ACP methyl ester carboxylesterase
MWQATTLTTTSSNHAASTPFILLHGMFESRLMFRNWKPTTKTVLIAMDRPGYGDNGAYPQQASYSYLDFAAFALHVLDEIDNGKYKNSRFKVLGHSSGGPCAMALASFAKHRCDLVIVVAGDVEYENARGGQFDAFHGIMPVPPDPDASAELLGLASANELEQDAKGAYATTFRASVRSSQGLNGPRLDFESERRPWGFAYRNKTDLPPLVLVYGDEDPYFHGEPHAKWFQANVAALTSILVLPGRGHFDVILDGGEEVMRNYC